MSIETNVVHTGDCFDVLAELPDESVHMVMTSPPYFGLRDYGHEDQIGLEESLDKYIQNLVEVFREVRRVLRPNGSAWLTLGDSYAGSGPENHDNSNTVAGAPNSDGANDQRGSLGDTSFGRKNKMLVPHRVAIALQDDGWVVRNDVTWVKPNPMPSSVKDRLNTTTEQIFHLTPNPDYWYDLDAIREPYQENTKARAERGLAEGHKLEDSAPGQSKHSIHQPADEQGGLHPEGKNPGDVFEVTTKPFPEAHFAVYPPELCEKPIKASCPKNGIVLDPFAGAGTTLLKAKELGRQFIGIELNAKYADMARARVGIDVKDPSNIRDGDSQSGLEVY